MGDADDGTLYACMGLGNMWEISVPSSSFSCEPKTALKNKVFLNVYLLKTFFFFLQKSRKKTQNVRLRKYYLS